MLFSWGKWVYGLITKESGYWFISLGDVPTQYSFLLRINCCCKHIVHCFWEQQMEHQWKAFKGIKCCNIKNKYRVISEVKSIGDEANILVNNQHKQIYAFLYVLCLNCLNTRCKIKKIKKSKSSQKMIK